MNRRRDFRVENKWLGRPRSTKKSADCRSTIFKKKKKNIENRERPLSLLLMSCVSLKVPVLNKPLTQFNKNNLEVYLHFSLFIFSIISYLPYRGRDLVWCCRSNLDRPSSSSQPPRFLASAARALVSMGGTGIERGVVFKNYRRSYSKTFRMVLLPKGTVWQKNGW